MMKRTLSAVLAAVMCLSVTMPVYADEVGTEPDDSAAVTEEVKADEDAAAEKNVDVPEAAPATAAAADMTLDEAIARVHELEAAMDHRPFAKNEISDEDMEILRRVVNYQYTGTDMNAEDGEMYTDAFTAYKSIEHIKPEGSTDYFYDHMTDRYKRAYDACMAQLEYFYASNVRLEDTYCMFVVDVPGTNWTYEELCAVWMAVFYSNPEYWFMDSSYDTNVDESGNGTIAFNCIDVAKTPEDRKTAETAIMSKVNSILTAVASLPTERQKSEKMAELIGEGIIYDPVIGANEDPETFLPYTMYGALCTDTAVCLGYSLTMQYLCALSGIESIIMVSVGGTHAWNRVKLDGTWYETDVTWYDQFLDENGEDPEQWLNVSTAYIRRDDEDGIHKPGVELYEFPYDGVSPIQPPECTHTTAYMPFVNVGYEHGKAVLSWADIGAEHYDVYLHNVETDAYDLIDSITSTSYDVTFDTTGGNAWADMLVMSDWVFRAVNDDVVSIDLAKAHTLEDPVWEWSTDDQGHPVSATAVMYCTECDLGIVYDATLTREGEYVIASVEVDGKTYTDKQFYAPAKPTVQVKTAFGGRTVQLNCVDTDAEIYYQFGSSNITTDCAHVKEGETIFLDEPMTGNKAAMYFKAYKDGKWSELGKWGVLNVQIAQPLIRLRGGNKFKGSFKIYTQTKNSYIVYTLDGSTPSIEEGTQKLKVKNGKLIWSTQGEITVPYGKTVKAIAVRCGLVTSDVMTYTNR